MTPDERVEAVRRLLEEALEPRVLEITDESELHSGHAGARTGMSHLRVRMVAEAFAGKSRVERHRMVYGALGDLMHTDIHALALDLRDAGGPAECGD